MHCWDVDEETDRVDRASIELQDCNKEPVGGGVAGTVAPLDAEQQLLRKKGCGLGYTYILTLFMDLL
jgi:hypothetical protein